MLNITYTSETNVRGCPSWGSKGPAVFHHMTLHWSPGATGAAAAGDPLPFPISPSRLRPWKAPKKESSLAWAGLLAGVAWRRYNGKRKMITGVFPPRLWICLRLDAGLPSGGSGGSWSEFSWRPSLRSSWPVQLAGVSFNTRHMDQQVNRVLILINQVHLLKELPSEWITAHHHHPHPTSKGGILLAYLSLFSSSW